MVKEKPYGKVKVLNYLTMGILGLIGISIVGRIIISFVARYYSKQALDFTQTVVKLSELNSWSSFFSILVLIALILSIITLITSLTVKDESDINHKYNKRVMLINSILLVIMAVIFMIN